MNIAICDDQLDYLNLIEKKVIQCFDEKEIPLKTYAFSNIADFVDSLRFQSYQFAFIEMRVQGGRGIEAARRIRRKNPACRIIFISDKYYNIPEAFQVHALEYLLKPIVTEKFKNVLDFALEWYRQQNIRFVVPIREIARKKIFTVDEIKYVETYYNDLEIVTVDERHYMTHVKNRYKLRPALRARWFIQVNQSVLVNMKCIDFLTDRNVILKSREVFPTSRGTLIQNHMEFEDFLKHQNKNEKK
ncbi:MAG: LytR/AlgR family response regulator transcription factor [Longibaculum sp.]